MYSSAARSLKSGEGGCVPPGAPHPHPGGESILASSSVSGCRHSLAYGRITPISASLVTLPPLSVPLPCVSLLKTLVTGFRVHLENQGDRISRSSPLLHLQRAFSQIRSVLGIGQWTHLLQGHPSAHSVKRECFDIGMREPGGWDGLFFSGMKCTQERALKGTPTPSIVSQRHGKAGPRRQGWVTLATPGVDVGSRDKQVCQLHWGKQKEREQEGKKVLSCSKVNTVVPVTCATKGRPRTALKQAGFPHRIVVAVTMCLYGHHLPVINEEDGR